MKGARQDNKTISFHHLKFNMGGILIYLPVIFKQFKAIRSCLITSARHTRITNSFFFMHIIPSLLMTILLTHFQMLDLGAHFVHNATRLVSYNHRVLYTEWSYFPVHQIVDVRAANPDAMHLQENLIVGRFIDGLLFLGNESK